MEYFIANPEAILMLRKILKYAVPEVLKMYMKHAIENFKTFFCE